MRLGLATAIVAVIASSTTIDAADRAPIACADVPSPPDASTAFDKFCARCHDANRLSRSYFADADGPEASRREARLAVFLDRHSSCPHRHHEAIAAWLRELVAPK